MEEKLNRVLDELNDHGECLARIDERTKQHEKRMDRADRRATGLGAFAGLLAGFFAAVAKAFVGGGSN